MRYVHLSKDRWSVSFRFSTEMIVPFYKRFVNYEEYGTLSYSFSFLFLSIRLTRYRGH